MLATLFSRKYTEIRAVDGVSFDIHEGEIVGYIGSNGAGKSTTIKMMCGVLTPTSGKVLIGGMEPYLKRRVVAKDIGVVFGQKTQLWWVVPLVESFKVLKEVYQVNDSDCEERIAFLSSVLGIDEFMAQPVRFILIFILPFGLFISLPVDALLYGSYNPYLLSLIIVGVAVAFFALATLIWTLCARRYESTGS